LIQEHSTRAPISSGSLTGLDASRADASPRRRTLLASRRALALVALVLLMLVWGSTFVVTKAVVRELPPLTLACLRFFLAAGTLAPFAIARGGLRQLPSPVPFGALATMALAGVVGFSVGFNYALAYASATQGALIYALVPAAIALAAVVVLKETPSRRRMFGVALSILGVSLVVASGEAGSAAPAPLLGAASMLLAVLSWTAYTVLAKRLAAADQIVVTACVSALGALMLVPLAALEIGAGGWLGAPTVQGWIGFVFLAVVASALAFIVYGRVLRELDASLVGAYSNLDPIIGVLTAVIVLGEPLRGTQIAGGVIALAGMWLASQMRSPSRGEA
jgi:drug/metabolite transporter (DMT)-like permease